MPYAEIGEDIGALVDRKNRAYGDSFNNAGDVLKILYPNGVKLGEYKTLLAVTRIIDKLFRIATDKGAFNEEPWKDIAGYAILMAKDKTDVRVVRDFSLNYPELGISHSGEDK